jgi:hypothetical protein
VLVAISAQKKSFSVVNSSIRTLQSRQKEAMYSVVSTGILVIVLALVIYTCAMQAEGFITLFNLSQDLHPANCTRDPSKCCPGAYNTPRCTGFDFARPSNFNDTIKLPGPASANAPTLPSCSVNRMTADQRRQLELPQNLLFANSGGESTSLSEMLGKEAHAQLQTMCDESARVDAVRGKVRALENDISMVNTTAHRNMSASQDLNTQDSDHKYRALQLWRTHCEDHTYQNAVVNDQCNAVHEFALPTAVSP